MSFLKSLVFFVIVGLIALAFLSGCSVEAETKYSKECKIYTTEGSYHSVNKETVYFDSNTYSLNFIDRKGKNVSTNSFTTVCD